MKFSVRLSLTILVSTANSAELYLQLEDESRTKMNYQRMIDRDPNNAGTYLSLAEIYTDNEWIDDAVAAYEKAISLAPDNLDYIEYFGEFYSIRGIVRGPSRRGIGWSPETVKSLRIMTVSRSCLTQRISGQKPSPQVGGQSSWHPMSIPTARRWRGG